MPLSRKGEGEIQIRMHKLLAFEDTPCRIYSYQQAVKLNGENLDQVRRKLETLDELDEKGPL